MPALRFVSLTDPQSRLAERAAPAMKRAFRVPSDTPAQDETRAHRADVDARLFGESKQQLAFQADFPVTRPDHPDFLLAFDTALAASAARGKHLATEVGIKKTSTWIDCVMPNPGCR